MEVQKAPEKQVAKTIPYNQHSQRLIQCLISMDMPEKKSEAKMEFLNMTGNLMPGGTPTYLDVIKYPMVKSLVTEVGKKRMLKVIYLMVRDFCSSINVVRNMNEDQMIEAAAMLIDECGNFRLEDYAMMVSMGKRGELVKIYDRIDLPILSQVLDEYWRRRHTAAVKLEESESQLSSGPSSRLLHEIHPIDTKMIKSVDGLASAFGELKNKLMEWREGNAEPKEK
jgi:hypothetical protein